jgi:hypothetical protein
MQQVLSRLRHLGRTLWPPAASAPVRVHRRPARKPRDLQRGRVYRWEAEQVFPHARERLSLEQCRNLVELAFRWHERPGDDPKWVPPRVEDGRGRRYACGSRAAIKLPRWARTPAVVLHECTHGMTDDQHGPRFVAAYVALLERFAGLDRGRLLATLAAANVRIAPTIQAGRAQPAAAG